MTIPEKIRIELGLDLRCSLYATQFVEEGWGNKWSRLFPHHRVALVDAAEHPEFWEYCRERLKGCPEQKMYRDGRCIWQGHVSYHPKLRPFLVVIAGIQ